MFFLLSTGLLIPVIPAAAPAPHVGRDWDGTWTTGSRPHQRAAGGRLRPTGLALRPALLRAPGPGPAGPPPVRTGAVALCGVSSAEEHEGEGTAAAWVGGAQRQRGRARDTARPEHEDRRCRRAHSPGPERVRWSGWAGGRPTSRCRGAEKHLWTARRVQRGSEVMGGAEQRRHTSLP